uniref:Uncharacterized protein n=1 Tax=Ursus maritimus TaxID=29073 RepID=A0A452V1X2_URSMA
ATGRCPQEPYSQPSLSQFGREGWWGLDDTPLSPPRSIHNGVIAVFQRKGLPDQELFSLNEGVRQLLKTELGSFFTEYLQNQLLTKGMVILRDKIRFYEETAGFAGRDVGLLLQ